MKGLRKKWSARWPSITSGSARCSLPRGQSNSTNCGQEKIRQKSGMVSSFSGTGWQLADDPQPGVHDNSTGGSYWPAFGDAMFEEYQVPIGLASTGHSGTSVNQWARRGARCAAGRRRG